MGEVYRARDTKLDRQVAIKILSEPFAHDPERIARFEREAKTLASLNHPNIAGLHGFEEAEGIKALVMELVEGPTLADILACPALYGLLADCFSTNAGQDTHRRSTSCDEGLRNTEELIDPRAPWEHTYSGFGDSAPNCLMMENSCAAIAQGCCLGFCRQIDFQGAGRVSSGRAFRGRSVVL
jgi:hypothetical protein